MFFLATITSNRADWLIPLAFSVLVGLISIYPASDCDTFWHLANGRWMVEHGAIATRDVFSYTAPGAVFDNRYWLAQIGLFAIYEFAGVNGLIVFKSIGAGHVDAPRH